MPQPGPLSERALVLAPNGRDAQVAQLILMEAGFPCAVCSDFAVLCSEISKGAGLAIVADEAIVTTDLHPVSAVLEEQPSWSDFPIILLTRHGGGLERNPVAARMAEALGNVTFLERPFHPTTLVSVVRTAVRSRRRQYEARSRLAELADERASLSNLTATLEQRVRERTAELMSEVAARERAQEQLLQSQKVEALGQLTGGVAHDFNNLLTAVMANLELLRKRVANDARSIRLVDAALQGADRGASLTQRMLAFARQQDLKADPVDLGLLLTGMRDLLTRSLGPRVDLRIQINEGLPPALVDANQVELAILNLAINARDAMPEGGTISITVEGREDGHRIGLVSGSYLLIQVVDTGQGMDAATLKKAVEPFFSTKPVGRGTGLGLSMVHGLATQLGGTLELSSEVGKGTIATLWLPAAPHAAIEVAPAGPSVGTEGRPATILVVDDDVLISMSTADMLQDLGHTVIEAHSPKKALEILEAKQGIDLLLTDQAMPGMTGTELADIVRRTRPNLPIILATGYAELPSGQNSDLPRLSKPYHQAELREQINRLLEDR